MVGLDSSPLFNDFACFKSHGRQGGCRLLFGHWQAACTICGAHSLQYPHRIMHLSFCQSSSFTQIKQSAGCFRICQKQPAPFYLSDIFKQNLRQSSSRPFPRCWFAHGSRQTVRGRCRACFSINRVWARCAHSIRLHPPKRSIRRCAR